MMVSEMEAINYLFRLARLGEELITNELSFSTVVNVFFNYLLSLDFFRKKYYYDINLIKQ